MKPLKSERLPMLEDIMYTEPKDWQKKIRTTIQHVRQAHSKAMKQKKYLNNGSLDLERAMEKRRTSALITSLDKLSKHQKMHAGDWITFIIFSESYAPLQNEGHILTAASIWMETAERERNCAAMLGFKKENIYIYDEFKPTELLDIEFSYIVVLGGHTLRLLSKVRELHLDTFIKDQVANGAIYLGFSAGAYLACDDIEYVKNYDKNDGFITDGNFHALGFTDKYVLCHFDYRDEKDIQLCKLYIGDDVELITLNNDQLIKL